jgi:hypothetical protein
VTIVARIPFVVVDAIEDSDQRGGASAQHLVQSHAVFGGADLARVRRTDSGDGVRIHAAVLERVDATGAQIILVQQVGVVAEGQIGDRGGRELTLVTDVVDREHRAGIGEQLIPAVQRTQQQRSESGMPVMAVQDLRTPGQVLAALDGDARQGEESQVLIGRKGIDRLPRVQRRAVDQVHLRLRTGQRGRVHRILILVRTDADRQTGQARCEAQGNGRTVDGGVQRREQPDVMAMGVQVLGERGADIGEAAGLGEGRGFGGDGADSYGHGL